MSIIVYPTPRSSLALYLRSCMRRLLDRLHDHVVRVLLVRVMALIEQQQGDVRDVQTRCLRFLLQHVAARKRLLVPVNPKF